MPYHLALAGLWGGLLALERRAFLQAMFSRPLVAAAGAGLLLEDVTSGLFVGLLFELYYLGGASLGGAHTDHETLPAVALLEDAAKDMTTLHVRGDQLRSVVAPYPVVKDLRVSTDFPHGLKITVVENTPVAVVTADGAKTPVSGDGQSVVGAGLVAHMG